MGVISDPDLLARLRVPPDEWVEHVLALMAHFPPRGWTAAAFDRGLRYPWFRPETSYGLRDGIATPLADLTSADRGDLLARQAGRLPLLAIGSNAAPRTLTVKFAHHEDPADREVLVLTGELHDLDVVASAALTVYGSMPATLAPSPGTVVRAAVLLVSPVQLTTLTWGELTYALGRLDGVRFTAEETLDGLALEAPLAFTSRWGAFTPDGEPAALAAVPARRRAFRPWTQRELLDRVAELTLGPAHGAEDLTRAIFADAAGTVGRALAVVHRHVQPFDHPGWTPVR